jgi:hypothetical protein
MSIAHSLLRSLVDFSGEAAELVNRFDKRDMAYTFTREDLHTIRAAATMAEQACRAANQLVGYLDAKFTKPD